MSLRMALSAFLETSIASAATTDLGSLNTMWALVTGTAAITSFGTRHNCWRYVRFASAGVVLTHNSTSLILPGSANITTAANDQLFARSDTSGNWRVQRYTRASGKALIAPAYSEVTSTPTLADGTYSPTLTNSTNVTASTTGVCIYARNGNSVYVAGKFNVQPTATGSTLIDLSLPIASNFTLNTDASGVGAIASQPTPTIVIFAETASDTLRFFFVSPGTANYEVRFACAYIVK